MVEIEGRIMKKKIFTAFMVGVIFCACVTASNRQQLYRKFGPKLLEAIVMVIKDEINLLRAQHSLPARTNQQLIDAIDTKLADVNDYDWME